MAPGSTHLYRTGEALKANGVKLLDTIDTYYELVDKRISGHGEGNFKALFESIELDQMRRGVIQST